MGPSHIQVHDGVNIRLKTLDTESAERGYKYVQSTTDKFSEADSDCSGAGSGADSAWRPESGVFRIHLPFAELNNPNP